MSIFANLFKKQADADAKVVGNVEDFVSLTRVYFQSVIAVNLGITNIRFLFTIVLQQSESIFSQKGDRYQVADGH